MQAKEFPNIKIFRFENAIFFVSVEHFRNTLYKLTMNPRHLKHRISKAKLKAQKQRGLMEIEYNIRVSIVTLFKFKAFNFYFIWGGGGGSSNC